jgi:hypothetical protein
MLDRGPYPGFLKRRIRSDLGHLSNHDAARTLAKTPRKGAMSVFLAHLSRQNNHPAPGKSGGRLLSRPGLRSRPRNSTIPCMPGPDLRVNQVNRQLDMSVYVPFPIRRTSAELCPETA